MNRFQSDIIMGKNNELKFKNYIEDKENIKLKQYKDKYAELDFRCDKRLLELKSRTICYNEFRTTMVGYNKIKKARRKKKFKTEFYFLFTDGLYKWKYNEEEISCVMPAVRTDRGKFEIKDHAFIHIKYLELISKNIISLD